MALVTRPLDPLSPLEILSPLDSLDLIDRWDFWDRLRHWRTLDYFDAVVPSFFSPLVPARFSRLIPSRIVRSKSLSHLAVGHEIVSKDGFQVQLDVFRFKPHEVEVRIVEDCIVVEGNQKEQWDNCKTTTNRFSHRYSLPIGFDPWQVSASLCNRILTIRAPPPTRSLIKCHSRYVPIKHI